MFGLSLDREAGVDGNARDLPWLGEPGSLATGPDAAENSLGHMGKHICVDGVMQVVCWPRNAGDRGKI